MAKQVTYEKHQREYTIIGSLVIMAAILGKPMFKFFGGKISEIISVVKNGIYYHLQVEGERQAMSRCFLRRLNKGQINLAKEYKWFVKKADEYEKFIIKKNLAKEDYLTLVNYYVEMAPVALASFDPIDVIDELDKNKRKAYLNWCAKTRRREEVIYKNGEMKFLPRYLAWFKTHCAPIYQVEELKYLLYFELIDFIKKGQSLPSRAELQKRKKWLYVRQYPFWQIKYLSGAKAKKIVEQKNLLNQNPDLFASATEVKGVTAFAGKVRGKARLIRGRADLADFKPGEIIIAPMTEPSYLPIMKQALAFVTNEGGLLCHAAIVARELKKPCVIGTKFATHVFHDGELIEVDANSGVVKKIL